MERIITAQAVIPDQSGRVLMQLRSWPPGWEPPGGHVAPGEDPSMTVVRETAEECGLEIAVDWLVGHYHFRGIRFGTDAIYRAHLVGGARRPTREALRLAWALPDQLPRATFPWYRQRIRDAIGPRPGQPLDRWQPVSPGQVLTHGAALTAEAGAALASLVLPRRRS